MTYSIVGRDVAAGQVGAAVQSAWWSSATAVMLVEAGVGAVVTQAMSERAFAYLGLQSLAAGSTASDAIAALIEGDTMPAIRQLGIIDFESAPTAFTGSDCVPSAGHHVGVDCVAQANMMEHSGVPQAMVAAFEVSDGDLTRRLLTALDAAQGLGGDFRGMQSAGLVVRSGERDTPEWSTALVDVRVDDHPEPLRELRRLMELATSYRFINVPFVRLVAGDPHGALEAARRLLNAAPADPNVQMRLGIVLLAAGEPEGRTILSGLVAKNEKWAIYMRRSLQYFGIDPAPLLADLRVSESG